MAVVTISSNQLSPIDTGPTLPEIRGYQNTAKNTRFNAMSSVASNSVPVETIVYRRTIYYRKRGWYAASSAFEFCRTTDPGAGNPSGNTLIDITIIGTVYEP